MIPGAADATADFEAIRAAEFPWAGETIYLNHASTGPLPERTIAAVSAFNRRRAKPHLITDAELFSTLDRGRHLAARMINGSPDEIALSVNTTYGLNVAALGLPLERGDIVVVSDREFPANVYPWMRAQERGIELELVPTTAEGWPDEDYLVARVSDPRVKVLAVSLVQFSTGYQVDLARLSAATRAHGTYLVVDAIQGVGQVPVDLRATPVDILSAGAQKWMLSPWGSGFTWIRRELIAELEPAMVSWMAFAGTDDFSRLTQYDPTLRDNARRFELITLPYQDFVGMNSSLELLLEVGVERVQARIRELHQPLLAWADRRGVRVASPRDSHGSGIICLAPPEPARVQEQLRATGVIASLREGAIRISPHFYNTIEEMERVVEELEGGRAGRGR